MRLLQAVGVVHEFVVDLFHIHRLDLVVVGYLPDMNRGLYLHTFALDDAMLFVASDTVGVF